MHLRATLDDFLAAQGFRRHDLGKNRVGHFQLVGDLEGRPIDVLVDTGAASTVIDLAYCRDQGLPLQDTQQRGGGAGGVGLPIYTLPGVALSLGGVRLQSGGIYALDLSHVNEGLVAQGAGSIHAVLGADILARHAAIVDYGASALYLRLSDA